MRGEPTTGLHRVLVAVATALSILASGCGVIPPAAGAALGGTISVVATENFWGSIAAQVGGTRVSVTSIITNPDADPHDHEPTAADARAMAAASLVIENGLGYDPWAPKLLSADSGDSAHRRVLNVGHVLGLADGANPHRWYNPTDVSAVIAATVGDLSRIDPAHAGYFQAQAAALESVGLATYHGLIAQIRARYAGTPVGASESIFSMLAPALGLKLITPYSFLKAISEGTDVSSGDKTAIDDQINHHQIEIYVYNSQNTTPDVLAQLAECRRARIPTATITETLTPANATYQAWQSRQLQGILAALTAAANRRARA